jgi:hypothetical protein
MRVSVMEKNYNPMKKIALRTIWRALSHCLSSPHLFVKPSTFSLLLNCFSPSSLPPSLFHSSSSFFHQWLQCTRTDKQTNFRPIASHSHQVNYLAVGQGQPFPWTTGETLEFGPVFVWFAQGTCSRPEHHGFGGWCAAQEQEEFLGNYFWSAVSIKIYTWSTAPLRVLG